MEFKISTAWYINRPRRISFKSKCQEEPPPRNPLSRKSELLPAEREEPRASLSTSTESSNKCTPRLVSPRSPWASWTPSSTMSSKESPVNHPNSSDTPRDALSLPARSRPPSDSSSPENSPATPSLKAPRPSPNTVDPHERVVHPSNVTAIRAFCLSKDR